jgi:hypothetical protein
MAFERAFEIAFAGPALQLEVGIQGMEAEEVAVRAVRLFSCACQLP